MTILNTGLGIAASAAIIAIATASSPARAFPQDGTSAKTVHCYGVNECKGTSDCKTASNECKGQNDCKGHGFKTLTAEACTAAGGSLTESK